MLLTLFDHPFIIYHVPTPTSMFSSRGALTAYLQGLAGVRPDGIVAMACALDLEASENPSDHLRGARIEEHVLGVRHNTE